MPQLIARPGRNAVRQAKSKPLVEALQRKGVRVSVASTIRSSPPMIADDLRRQADNFIELEELREVVGRPPREPREPRPEGERRFERGERAAPRETEPVLPSEE